MAKPSQGVKERGGEGKALHPTLFSSCFFSAISTITYIKSSNDPKYKRLLINPEIKKRVYAA